MVGVLVCCNDADQITMPVTDDRLNFLTYPMRLFSRPYVRNRGVFRWPVGVIWIAEVKTQVGQNAVFVFVNNNKTQHINQWEY